MKSPIETPKISPNHQPFVTRIYTTKGFEATEYHPTDTPNGTHSKSVGVEINGMIHWINKTFSNVDDLKHIFLPLIEKTENGFRRTAFLNVFIDSRGRFRNLRDNVDYLDKKMTKIPVYFEHLPPSYMKRSLPVSDDNYFWSMEQLRAKYYS